MKAENQFKYGHDFFRMKLDMHLKILYFFEYQTRYSLETCLLKQIDLTRVKFSTRVETKRTFFFCKER